MVGNPKSKMLISIFNHKFHSIYYNGKQLFYDEFHYGYMQFTIFLCFFYRNSTVFQMLLRPNN